MTIKKEAVVTKLMERAFDFGNAEAGFTLYDSSDSMHAIDAHMEAGDALAELLGYDSFPEFIYSNPDAIDKYVQGYASAVHDVEDLPEDLNDGRASCLTIELNEEQQVKARELIMAEEWLSND